ncbi:hypothetical protein [Dongia mobilis]|uniref:hypothetical protein n=1 Tax=Dongia sp. TaxID=1977262 RepID=UPI0026EEFBE4
MPQETTLRRKVQPLKSTPQTRATVASDDYFGAALKALEALNTAYRRVARVLTDEIDRSRSNVDEISALGGRLRWVTERQKLVRTALQAGPGLVAYVCGDCQEVKELRSLAETAAKLANDSKAYPTTLNLLNYIDHELGWTPLAQSA